MRIQHNIMAMNAYRNYNTNTSALSKNLEKLSSGYKINRAGDDAAGLAISEKMRAQITGLNAAQKNVKDGISLVKTAEGAMQEIQDMLNRMDYLATQSANGTYDDPVDRYNLQKEVNQLRSEINRIADSANFNGIKLLDGKAGVNTQAFQFSSVSAQAGQAGGAVPITFAAATAANDDYHLSTDSVTAQAPEFSLNLDTLEFDVSGITANATVAVTFSIGGIAVGITLAQATGKYTTSDIADAIVAAFNTQTVSGSANAGGLIGADYVFEAAKDGTSVKFTLVGKKNGANYDSFGADDIVAGTDDTALNLLNGVKGGDVSIALGTGVVSKGYYNHKVDDVKNAIGAAEGQRAGITFDLSDSLLAEGSTLTIDGVTFTFLTDASNTATAGTADIDLRNMAGATTAAKLEKAINELSQKSAGKFDITKKDNGKIHIEQTAASYAAGDRFKTDAELKGVVSAAAAAVAPVNAGTVIAVDSTKVNEGDRMTIGNKTFVFTSDASKVDSTKNEVQVSGKTANDLMAAAKTAGFDAEIDSNGAVVVRSATAGEPAPLVSGTGLTLQIGDTSDSFNQLSVKIGDMHTSAMGDGTTTIADIDISNAAGASDAINVIKSAINYVSGIRGDLGATQNRLEHTANNLSVMAENIQDAESTIRDTDIAEEMMSYTKNNILVQSAQAMLAQANAVPQGVLQLLG